MSAESSRDDFWKWRALFAEQRAERMRKERDKAIRILAARATDRWREKNYPGETLPEDMIEERFEKEIERITNSLAKRREKHGL